jgi:hypothetical protein
VLRVGGGQCRHHNLAPDADHLAVVVHQSPAGAEDRPRLGQKDAKAKVFQHPQRCVMHHSDFIVGNADCGAKA